ncbi:bifunctional lytic transglycosylase/C40 family peptidase [Streptomyces sp. NPDC002855]|uniref:C40 family peptidase n=1 Tax=Streptomyces sp. NPDC002855 TaxID=3154437 RepID=UPI00332E6DD2
MGKLFAAVGGVLLLLLLAIAAGASSLLSPATAGAIRPSARALADIPASYLALYRTAAATCPGLDWSTLAAIGKIETDHGRSPLPGVRSGSNYAGAQGPMQFLRPTFDSVIAKRPPPRGGATPPSPYNPHDAIHTAAAYLCQSGARHNADLRAAIFAYNHADWYVSQVLAQARTYRSSHPASTPVTAASAAPARSALRAVSYAQDQLGLPYVWGGDGPTAGDPGFDCSGLTKAAYTAAGITLPRTAQQQYAAGPRLPRGAPLLPGDLVFYGRPDGGIHHIGLYIGDRKMIDAPGRSKNIRIAPYRYAGDDYAGATRPTKNS